MKSDEKIWNVLITVTSIKVVSEKRKKGYQREYEVTQKIKT